MEKSNKTCCKKSAKTKDETVISTIGDEQIQESNFKLRSDLGVTKITFNDGQSISQTDAPDETCIGFLKANPSRISMFEKYPENWQDLIKNNEKENEDE